MAENQPERENDTDHQMGEADRHWLIDVPGKIDVEVWVRPPHGQRIEERQKVTEARFVMVALDDNGRIRAVHSE